LTVPEGVHLIDRVVIGTFASGGGTHLRAQVALPSFARGDVRLEGRRVYLDLTWPGTGKVPVPRMAPAPPASSVATNGSASGPVAPPGGATVTLAGVDAGADARPRRQGFDRLEAIGPFLVSAVRSPSPEVMAALDRTLADLEASVASRPAETGEAAEHALLLSATRSARRALEPGFTGSRLDQARHALGMLQMARPSEAAPQAMTAGDLYTRFSAAPVTTSVP
jgi:hypothetical protein